MGNTTSDQFFENCSNLNLYNVIDLNSIVRCAKSLEGKKSNSASPSDILLFNFPKDSNYNGESIKGGFQKIFIANYPELYKNYFLDITKGRTIQVSKQIEALFYEYYIYLEKIRQITEKNVNPHFIKVLGGSLLSKYWDMKNFILNHVDPVIQTELLKNINLGDITDEQIKINFVDNFIYMVHNIENRPSLTKTNKTSSLNTNLIYFTDNKPTNLYKNIFNFIERVQYSFILTEQIYMYPDINNFYDFLDIMDGYSMTLDKFLILLSKIQSGRNRDEIQKITEIVFYFYFQITSACYALFLSGVNHNDLHAGNVIIKKIKPCVNEYNVNGNRWQIFTDFTVLLYDFDRAYCYDYENMLNSGTNSHVKNSLNSSKDLAKIFYYLFKMGDDNTKRNIANRIAKSGQKGNLYNFYMNQPDQWIEERITETELNTLFANPVTIMINLFDMFARSNDEALKNNPGLHINTYICDKNTFLQGNINLNKGLNKLKSEIRYDCEQNENSLLDEIKILKEKNEFLLKENEDLIQKKDELESRMSPENLV